MKQHINMLGAAVLLATTSFNTLAADAANGEASFALCTSCHGAGAEGQESSNAPRLAGQHGWYIERQLKNFRTGVRGAHPDDSLGQQMAAMANTISGDDVVADIATWVASLKPEGRQGAAKGDATKGEGNYAVCQSCHGANGEGSQASNAPRLAGLQSWYIVRQLNNFRAGTRGAQSDDSLGQQMAAMANTLPDGAAVEDVAAYIATLK